ncbi:MAG: Cytochrome c oxidase subunit 6A, mitochondrial [Cyphobasidiales sp. Tagirdzhanova-0007]|nr:MAG: Cytochrome c oxidase subunit 6A, mitochondrial [Cyphobasidiales sp. Tagirdzhanova-0007]
MQRAIAAFKVLPRTARSYSVATAKAGAEGNEFVAAREAQKEHAGGSADLWRKISYFVALPMVVVAYVNVRNMEAEHAEHAKHEEHEETERISYPYMGKLDKEFPWGKHSTPSLPPAKFCTDIDCAAALFFNPRINIDRDASE